MFVSYKTPLKQFKTGLCQWEGLDFLWILVIVSIHDPTLDYSNRIPKVDKFKYGEELFSLGLRFVSRKEMHHRISASASRGGLLKQ